MAGKKVLVVDDTRLNLELSKDLLELAGFAVSEAMTGEEGINKAFEEQPDIVLLDIELPDMSGITVLEHLKEDQRTHDIPVVALTGYSRPEDQDQLQKSGIAGLIIKPFDTKTFAKTIASFLNS